MRDITNEVEFRTLLEKFIAHGGVLDYFMFEVPTERQGEEVHRDAAIFAMTIICSQHEYHGDPLNQCGELIDLETFWGLDDFELKQDAEYVRCAVNVDGYKSAFFCPPYDLRGTIADIELLFDSINRHVLGDGSTLPEIYSWSTDWSSYFDAGHEWWGAFYWTIRPAELPYIVMIGASTTD